MNRPIQSNWKDSYVGGEDTYTPMERHESHLSKRKRYNTDEFGDFRNDAKRGGHLHRSFIQDSTGTSLQLEGTVESGVLLYVPGSSASRYMSKLALTTASADVSKEQPGSAGGWVSGATLGDHHHSEDHARSSHGSWSGVDDSDDHREDEHKHGSTGRFFWYGEHRNPLNLNSSKSGSERHLLGGVMACSTSDFKVWRNEGTMLHFSNISYNGPITRQVLDIQGQTWGPQRQGNHGVPIYNTVWYNHGAYNESDLVAQRPKVLYNNISNKFIMWMEVHDYSGTLGVAGIAVSDFPTGPFEFNRSFLPDKNETHDQTVVHDKQTGDAFLIRTYYATVDYLLPTPVMQPLWESVKKADGSVNYGLNYHRATYDSGYDDSDDICIQRLRKEDVAFEIKDPRLGENATFGDPRNWVSNIYKNYKHDGLSDVDVYTVERQHELG